MYRRKLNRAWETLRSMPVPAIASDRLVDLHNDLTYYDTAISTQIREFLRERLAPYKIPRHVEFRPSLPKSNVGKILRRELRA